MIKRFAILALTLLAAMGVEAKDYGEAVRLDKTVHNFGTIGMKDGAQGCVFTVSNIGTEPLTILTVVSTCGCTSVEWTRRSIAPGESGKIEAFYKNEDGPYPFDKTIKAYFSSYSKPVVLHLKGVVKKK